MTSISVCMIVKNEEKTLAKCLNSLAGIPDEIIIVDTGSTDKTKKIAGDYTDKIFDFTWVDDFAAARNFSLEKATCEYVYVADADEMLDAENLARFRQLKQAMLPEVEVVEMAYFHKNEHTTTSNFEVEYRPKLFRRLRAFRYIDPLHEVLRTDPVVYRSNIVVNHHPAPNHGGRDLAHFKRLVDDGQRFSARLEMMYARELMLAGSSADFLNARPYFEAVECDASRSAEALRRAACILARVAAIQQDAAALLRYAAPELVGQPPAEICCALGDYFLAQNAGPQAMDWYGAALSGADPEIVAASAGRIPLMGLAACFEKAGDTQRAQQYRDEAQAWSAENLNPDLV